VLHDEDLAARHPGSRPGAWTVPSPRCTFRANTSSELERSLAGKVGTGQNFRKQRLRISGTQRMHASSKILYPNKLPTVPKPPRASRTASLVFSDLPASQGAITRLLNRYTGQNLYRGFESLPLRQNPSTCLSIRTYQSPLSPPNYMIRCVRRGIWCMFACHVLQRAHGLDCI